MAITCAYRLRMNFIESTALITLALFAGMLTLLEVGRRLGERRAQDDGGSPGLSAVEGAVFGLFGLLVAFTFSGASARFEANAIGTAWLRVDLLPEAAQPDMRARFRSYLDSRLEVYRDFSEAGEVTDALSRSNAIQLELWKAAVAATHGLPQPTMLLLPPMNEMIDLTTTRTMATRFHQPLIIFAVLIVLALLTSLLAGHSMAGMRRQRWLHMVGFAAVTSIAFFVILDLEFPRRGLIRVDSADQVLHELRASMG
jgi:hypothetical protein